MAIGISVLLVNLLPNWPESCWSAQDNLSRECLLVLHEPVAVQWPAWLLIPEATEVGSLFVLPAASPSLHLWDKEKKDTVDLRNCSSVFWDLPCIHAQIYQFLVSVAILVRISKMEFLPVCIHHPSTGLLLPHLMELPTCFLPVILPCWLVPTSFKTCNIPSPAYAPSARDFKAKSNVGNESLLLL